MISAAPMNTYVQYVFAIRFFAFAYTFSSAELRFLFHFPYNRLHVAPTILFAEFGMKFVATNLYRSHRIQT